MAEFLSPWSTAEGVARATAGFAAHFGYQPTAVYSAPGRVNLIGEHTDYNQGPCLPIALPHRTFVALSANTSDAVALASAAASPWSAPLSAVAPGSLSGWGCYPAGVAWALARQGLDLAGFDGYVDSCVPFGAGLSSSAALECAFALGLNDLAAQPWPDNQTTRRAMAKAAVAAENLIVGAATGQMDQFISLLAQPGHALLVDFATDQATPVPFDLARHGLALLVIDTKASHQLSDGQFAARRAQSEAAAQVLGQALGSIAIVQLEAALAKLDDPILRRRTRHVVSEVDRVRQTVAALEHLGGVTGERPAGTVLEGAGHPGQADHLSGGLRSDKTGAELGPESTSTALGQAVFRRVGQLFDGSHASLRQDYQVSCPELDLAVQSAQAAGAWGARMTGGGFGGSAIALVAADQVDVVADQVAAAFQNNGWRQPAFLVAEPSGPAQRER